MTYAIEMAADDGYALVGTLDRPAGPLRGAVFVAPAMGVRRSFYAPFARYLAEGGLATLTLDYRGIGGSRRGALHRMTAALHDWGELDLAAGLRTLQAEAPGVPLGFVGHSVGGQLLGLAPAAPVRAAFFVGAQSGHHRHWSGLARLGILALWYGMPLLVPAFGKLPMQAFGQGEDVPPGVALEWARWGRHRDYVLSHARERGVTAFDTWNGALRTVAIPDDGFAPLPGVKALAGFYRAARAEVVVLHPRDVGLRRLGHFGFFRAAAAWPAAREWLLGQLVA